MKPQQKILQQGAEAIILLSKNIITKDRLPKSYRLPELDEQIRKRRTKSETKLLEKASQIINSPAPIESSEWDKIQMPFIDGKKLSEHLDSFSLEKQKQICKKIGESIAKLHDNDIIHGDLTTSNMILVEPHTKTLNLKKISSLTKSSAKKSGKADFEAINREPKASVYFIDFGLGFISHKFEDKAVDLHLLKQALEAKHFKHWEELVKEVFTSYKNSKDSKIVFERLKAVEKRGRYKKH